MQVSFTDKKVTAWGGTKLMKDMLDSIGIKEFMGGLDLRKRVPAVGMSQCKSSNAFGSVFGSVQAASVTRLICVMTKCCKKYLVGSKRPHKVRTAGFFKNLVGSAIPKWAILKNEPIGKSGIHTRKH